jgi:hypothetical protein
MMKGMQLPCTQDFLLLTIINSISHIQQEALDAFFSLLHINLQIGSRHYHRISGFQYVEEQRSRKKFISPFVNVELRVSYFLSRCSAPISQLAQSLGTTPTGYHRFPCFYAWVSN